MKSKPVWSFKLAKERYVGVRRPVLSDEHVLVAFHYDKADFYQSKLLAFDPLSGKEAWSHVVDHVGNEPVNEGSVVYWSSFDGSVYALDARDGNLLWRSQVSGLNIGRPVVCGDRVVVGEILGGTGGTTWCLDRASGKTLWKFEHGGHTCSMAVADQRVFHSLVAHPLVDKPPSKWSLHALFLENGKAHWSVADRCYYYCNPIIVENRRYIYSQRLLQVRNAETGEVLSELLLGQQNASLYYFNPIIVENKLYVCSHRSFQVRNAKTGKLLSELLLEQQNASLSLAPGSDATRFYVWRDSNGQGSDTVTAIDVRSSRGILGERISLSVAWQKQEARGLCAVPQMLAGNTLAYLTHDGKLCFINPASGTLIQEQNLGTRPSTFGGMAAAHGHLFISHGRNLLALPQS
jgi:outer membrane protein assembly factor BamB